MQIVVADAAGICPYPFNAANGENIFGNSLAGGAGVTHTRLSSCSPSQNTNPRTSEPNNDHQLHVA
jgi:hypothetical protein